MGEHSSGSDFEESRQIRRPLQGMDGWSYKRESMQAVRFTPNLNCKEGILGQIHDTLTYFGKGTYMRFKQCCFGHLTNLPEKVGKCVSAIHYVITREIVLPNDGGDKTEISFYINNKRLRFRRFEFALITGLKFGGSSFNHNGNNPISQKSLYTREWENNKVCVDDLLTRFTGKKIGNNPDDYVKVAKILFVYFVLLGKDPKKTMVSDWMWILVEDEEAWDSFPWGSYSYQALLHYLKKIKTHPAGTKRESYSLYGFTTAFLTWIYCAIPQLGKAYGGVKSTTNTPRILRYHYTRSNAIVSKVSGELYSTLVPDEEEEKSKYWLSVEPEGTPFKLCYDHVREKRQNKVIVVKAYHSSHHEALPQPQNEIMTNTNQPTEQDESHLHRGHNSGDTLTADNPIFGFTWAHKKSWIDEIGLNTYTRIKSDKNLIDDIGKNVFTRLKGDKDFIEEIGNCAAKRIKAEMNEFLPGYLDYMMHQQKTHSEKFQSSPDPNYTTPIHDKPMDLEEDVFQSEVAVRSRNEIPLSKSAWKSIQVENSQIIPFPPKLDFTAVRRRVPSAALCSPFRNYEVRGRDYNNFLKSDTKRNVGLGYAVTPSFFKDMANVTKALESCHIDAYLACLSTNPEFGGLHTCHRRITITSTAFVPAVHRIWAKYHKEDELSPLNKNVEENISCEDLYQLSQFVIGEQPKWGQIKPWMDYDKVIVVVNMPLHWVTCCVNLLESYIMIYDSNQHTLETNDFEERRQFFIPLSRILPQVLKYAGFYDARPEVRPCLTQWRVEHPEGDNLYMQNNNENCGAYALKYVEAILTGKIEERFDAKELKKYRTHLSKSVYNFSTDESTL